MLHEMPYAQDGTITYETFISRYNSELANTLGNLVNRTVAMVKKYFDGVLYTDGEKDALDDELIKTALDAKAKMEVSMEDLRVADAIDSVWDIVRRSNKYIDETMPWALAKDENGKDRLKAVLYNLVECIRYISVMLTPFMPETAEKIAQQINCDALSWDTLNEFGKIENGKSVGEATPLFARIDEAKKLEELING